MGSAEGTFVNGKKVSRGALRLGDQITLGGLRIVLESPDARAALSEAVATPNHAVVAPTVAAPAPAQDERPRERHERQDRARRRGARRILVATSLLRHPAAAVAAAALPAPAPPPAPPRPRRRVSPAKQAPRARRAAAAEVEDLSGETDLGVELRVMWGDTLLEAGTFIQPKAPVLLGESPKCDVRLEGLPVDDFPVLRFEDGEYRFTFARGMTGVVEERAGKQTFGELVRAKKAAQDEKVEGAYWIPVPRAGAVRAEIGAQLAIEARAKRPEQVKGAPFWERINYQFLNLFLVLFFVQAGFIVAANNFPYDTDVVARRPVQEPLADGEVHHQAARAAEEARGAEGREEGRPRRDGREAQGRGGSDGQEGRAQDQRPLGPEGDRPEREGDREAHGPARRARPRRVGGGLSTVFGSGGLGGDLKGAVGNMFGPVVGDSYGLGGLGIRGSGKGGGGVG